MQNDLHHLLSHQLAQLKLSPNTAPTLQEWALLLQKISHTYTESESDHYFAEHSLETSWCEISELNEKLQHLLAERRIGTADAATAVLHNVGNVLNSVNVSIGIAQETLSSMQLDKLKKISTMIKNNMHHLPDYLTHDPKGKLIPEYLMSFSQNAFQANGIMINEIKNLIEHISHIKEIISKQQSLATNTIIPLEKIALSDVIENALQITGKTLTTTGIEIKKAFEETPTITVDKIKLYQILINLIQNAKDSLFASEQEDKKMIIKIQKVLDNQIKITIQDNGIGIAPHHIEKIFSFGFTTKKHGHGFGLHSCAIAAKELGGSLEAKSEGLEKGASFILTLPIVPVTTPTLEGT